jgi:hypothetical protein
VRRFPAEYLLHEVFCSFQSMPGQHTLSQAQHHEHFLSHNTTSAFVAANMLCMFRQVMSHAPHAVVPTSWGDTQLSSLEPSQHSHTLRSHVLLYVQQLSLLQCFYAVFDNYVSGHEVPILHVPCTSVTPGRSLPGGGGV